jgi:chemotaxis protein MotD
MIDPEQSASPVLPRDHVELQTQAPAQRGEASFRTHALFGDAGAPAADHRAAASTQPVDTVLAPRPHSDTIQIQGLQTPRDLGHIATVSAQAPATPTAAGTTPVPLEGLAVEIAARAQSGRNRFEIRLDPPELGRIEVRLDIDRSGQVTSRLVVERAETLDVLRRDAHELERALNQAGLKTGDNGLQFALRDQAFADREQGRSSDTAQVVVAEQDLPPVHGIGRMLSANGGIDIRI